MTRPCLGTLKPIKGSKRGERPMPAKANETFALLVLALYIAQVATFSVERGRHN